MHNPSRKKLLEALTEKVLTDTRIYDEKKKKINEKLTPHSVRYENIKIKKINTLHVYEDLYYYKNVSSLTKPTKNLPPSYQKKKK